MKSLSIAGDLEVAARVIMDVAREGDDEFKVLPLTTDVLIVEGEVDALELALRFQNQLTVRSVS